MATINYTDKAALLYVITKLHTILTDGWVVKESGKALSSNDFTTELKTKLEGIVFDIALNKDSEHGITNKAVATELENVAKLVGANFTGTVTLPTATEGTNDTTAATTAFVVNAIQKALAGISGIEIKGGYTSYEDLVAKETNPSKGVIYLVSKRESGRDASDEYFWTGEKFEMFGTTDVDLTGYVKETDMVGITETEINAMFDAAGF